MDWFERYRGLPFAEAGTDGFGPEAYHCYGLIRAAWRDELGIEIPRVPFDPDNDAAADREARAVLLPRCVAVVRPRELDLVECLDAGGRTTHLALWSERDRGGLCHALRRIGVRFHPRRRLPELGIAAMRYFRPEAA